MEWNVSPEIFTIGMFSLRWYSLMFIISFLLGYYIIQKIYKEENLPETYMDALFYYAFAATIIGARLGHCLFYAPDYYLANPLEILKVWEGGLASHGAAIAFLIAIYIYVERREGLRYLWVLDRVVIVVALAAFFIRIGNFFNSEILGKATDVPWAVKFVRLHEGGMVPRHPSQLYEAFAYLLIFLLLYKLYQAHKGKISDGYFLGLFLVLLFGVRFFVEYYKEVQEPWESGLLLNMGQTLSIPLVAIGAYLIYRSRQTEPQPLPKRPSAKAKNKQARRRK